MNQKRILMVEPVDIFKNHAPKIHFLNLAVNFKKLGWQTKVIVYSPKDNIKNQEKNLIDVKFIPNPLLGNKCKRIMKYLLSIPFIVVEFFSFKPTIIYFRFSPATFFYLPILRLIRFFTFKFQIALEFNDWVSREREILGESKIKIRLINFLEVKSALIADYIRAVSPGIKSCLNKYGVPDEKILVIENGTDIDHFKPINKNKAKESIGLDPDLLYIGFVGNFAVWQGINFLLRAIPSIFNKFTNVRILLVGDGPEMEEVKKKALEFKDEKIKITGYIPYEDVNLYINAFDIGTAPYIKDASFSPLKIRDYAACGIPIVASRIKGAGFVEDNNLGFLFPIGDTDSFKKSLAKLIEDSDLRKRMSQKGRNYAKKRLSWERIAKQILDNIKV